MYKIIRFNLKNISKLWLWVWKVAISWTWAEEERSKRHTWNENSTQIPPLRRLSLRGDNWTRPTTEVIREKPNQEDINRFIEAATSVPIPKEHE